jgi:hypothetical protein
MQAPIFISEEIALRKTVGNYISRERSGFSMEAARRPDSWGRKFPDLTNCSGTWTNTDWDNQNCGSCNVRCKSNETCCNGTCVSNRSNCGGCGRDFACGPSQQCCTLGYIDPVLGPIGPQDEFICRNVGSDPYHCKGCNQPCDFYWDPTVGTFRGCCDNGRCLIPPNDFLSENSHCGSCDNKCDAGFHCSMGHCCPNCKEWYDGSTGTDWGKYGAIAGAFFGGAAGAGLGKLAGDWLSGAIGPGCYDCETIKKYTRRNVECCNNVSCTDKSSDYSNCGTCGHSCSSEPVSGKICRGGQCVCPPNLPDVCDWQCMNLQVAGAKYCGTCGNVCNPEDSCCVLDARLGYRYCSRTLFDIDRNNCGSCGHQCSAGQSCCGGKCINTDRDTSNCGSCGNMCPPGEICCDGFCSDLKIDSQNCGSCNYSCFVYEGALGKNYCCNGKCQDLLNDNNNCGTCGYRCNANEWCNNGACSPPIL